MAVILTKHAAEVGTRDLGEIEAVQQWDASLNPQGATMNTKLTDKLRELRSLMIVKGDVDLVDECIALAAHPKGYVMSRDYNALYDHLLKGGDALGMAHFNTSHDRAVKIQLLSNGYLAIQAGDDSGGCKREDRKGFIAECTRLNLEWLAPHSPVGGEEPRPEFEVAKAEAHHWYDSLIRVQKILQRAIHGDDKAHYCMYRTAVDAAEQSIGDRAKAVHHPKGEVELTDEVQKFAHDFCGKWAQTFSSHDSVAIVVELREAMEKFLRDNGYLTKK